MVQRLILLICDEVMSGFRVAWGGAQSVYGLDPDISTFGKVIGGGLPLAAIAGKTEIMDQLAPQGPVYQAGTLAGNPLAVSVGIKVLEILAEQKEKNYQKLSHLSSNLIKGLKEISLELDIPMQTSALGGMLGYFFCNKPVRDHESAKATNSKLFKKFLFPHLVV